MTVREDTVEYPDGQRALYGVVEKPDFAVILPRENDGFWLVEQFRYPISARAWEFPQGGWGHGKSGPALDLARAELAEEVGATAMQVEHLGRLAAGYGFTNQYFDVFLATGLTHGEPDREPTEQDMVHRFISDSELAAMISTGAMCDSHSLAAFALYKMRY